MNGTHQILINDDVENISIVKKTQELCYRLVEGGLV